MVLDIPKEEEEDLEEKVEAASIDQTIDWMKGTSQLVQLEITIWDPDLTTGSTNQKLNAIIVKRQVIKLGIVGVQLRRLKRMQILW
jgi:RNase H-fold protein (predicted Holliday junction resolvase)